jgi:phosphoribosyl 1,2-cyclic phosphodiesterase
MSFKFTVLASGSAGNASLMEVDGFGLLLDAGVGPRILGQRLRKIGCSWEHIHAALLTHTHSDHWSDRILAHFARQKIPLYCHFSHRPDLSRSTSAFDDLDARSLIHAYEAGTEFAITQAIRCRPLALRHDGGATFGFRFEVLNGSSGYPCALGYAADLGSWTGELAESLADVDVLALEFNHDVELENSSGRPPELIARVLGDEGHLSNAQAAELLRDILRRSMPGRPRHLVQLHLSRECNRPALAVKAAEAALADCPHPITIHTASQHEPISPLVIEASPALSANSRRDAILPTGHFASGTTPAQLYLPGMGP